jgi:curved DNA-binding protein CbpA
MTFYAILGIPPDADEETIRTAYRALARQYHPDVGEGSSQEKFREVVDAYETLSDPERRRVYDMELGCHRTRSEPIQPLTPVEPLRGVRHTYAGGQAVFSRNFHLSSYLDGSKSYWVRLTTTRSSLGHGGAGETGGYLVELCRIVRLCSCSVCSSWSGA